MNKWKIIKGLVTGNYRHWVFLRISDKNARKYDKTGQMKVSGHYEGLNKEHVLEMVEALLKTNK